MRLSASEHRARPWLIHELAPDFRVEDVWALPTPGTAGDFPQLVRLMAASKRSAGSSRVADGLWKLRLAIGELLGWDDTASGVGERVPSLHERLPRGQRDVGPLPLFDELPFSSLYLLEDEWAAEMANRTVHGVMHIGWVPDGAGGYRGQMAVLVKPNGLLGDAYMAAIKPFRHRIVYPAVMRELGRGWRSREV